MTFRSKPRPFIMMDIDSEIAESVIRLADYSNNIEHKSFIEKIFSILLMTLMLDDINDCTNAFERILSQLADFPMVQGNQAWGEYFQLQRYFTDRYRYQKFLLEDLERLLPPDLHTFPEDMFVIVWKHGGTILMVG